MKHRKTLLVMGLLLIVACSLLFCNPVSSQLYSASTAVNQITRQVGSVTGLGRPAPKAKPVIEEVAPGEATKLPHKQIAVHRQLAEETGLYSVYCPWPGGGAPEYTMFNIKQGVVDVASQQNFFVQGGWLFGFVESPEGVADVQPPRNSADGLGGGRTVQFYRIRWSLGEDERSVQCVLEQPTEVELAIHYAGDGHVQVTVSGCGLKSEAVIGLNSDIFLTSKKSPEAFYGVPGSCELTAEYTILSKDTQSYQVLDAGQLEPIQANLKPKVFNEIAIHVPTEDGPMGLEEEIARAEKSLEEIVGYIDGREETVEGQVALYEAVEARLETLCESPDLHPEVREQLEYQLWHTTGMLISLGGDDFAEMREQSRVSSVKHLQELRAQRDDDSP